ncbi:SIS domain-containing protein [Sporichthya brevicatena]|uniref:SIS domain-containing protein n=1 Tax=Sporichthya brevicatena TaxID=171442 RepID=UPI0031CE702F
MASDSLPALTPDPTLLDDVARLRAGDPQDMLGAVASAGAQIRDGLAMVGDLDLGPRPRALVVAGMGGSAASGDVLVAAAGSACPIPLVVHRGPGLPAWVGPEDLVVGLSCSGTTEETLAAVAAAVERKTRLVTIGAPDSPLEIAGAGAPHLAVDAGGRQPRASLWSLATPLLLVGEAVGVTPGARADLAAAATVLDAVAAVNGPAIETSSNRAKELALHLAGGLPVLWGPPGVGATVANRFACQIAENAKQPSMPGVLSEAHHNQIVSFDGPTARADGLRLVVLADDDEPPASVARVEQSQIAAAEAGVPAVLLRGSGPDPVSRLAGLIALVDFASVYLALLGGVDPTPVAAIESLKARLAEADS